MPTVKGYTPAQMSPVNRHRERGPILASGATWLDKAELIMAITLTLGATVSGLLLAWAWASWLSQ